MLTDQSTALKLTIARRLITLYQPSIKKERGNDMNLSIAGLPFFILAILIYCTIYCWVKKEGQEVTI